MKTLRLLFIALLVGAAPMYSQIKVTPISYKDQDHFITTTIGYPVDGLFTIDGKKEEPIVQLNPDGTGVFQYEDLTKKNINWGIECSEEGIPIFREGFNSASYSFWYKPSNEENWTMTQFSIHFNKKKMFIMGERVKDYVDYNDLPKPKSK